MVAAAKGKEYVGDVLGAGVPSSPSVSSWKVRLSSLFFFFFVGVWLLRVVEG